MKRTLISASISLLFVSFPLQAAPISPPPPDSPILGTVVVSASRTAEELRDVSQSMVVISQNEIRENASGNVLDLLKTRGFQVGMSNVAGYDNGVLKMRGVSSAEHGIVQSGDILVLIDGRAIGTDNFSVLDMNAISRIEIIRGPGAMQYGSSAGGGVINVITERGRKKQALKVEAGLGSWDAKTLKASASGQSESGQFDYAVSASRFSVSDYVDGKGERNRNSKVGSREKYAVNLGWNIDKANRVGLAVQQTETNHAGYGTTPGTTYPQYKDVDYHAVDLTYEGASKNKNWFVRYFQGQSGYDLIREQPTGSQLMRPFSDYNNKFKGAQGSFNLDMGRFTLVTGVDFLYYDVDQNQPNYSYSTPRSSNLTHGEYTNTGVFAIGKAHLLEKRNLILSGGLRYDTFKSDLTTLYDFRPGQLKQLDVSSTYHKFLPSVGVAYHPLDYLKLRANYAHAFKMPTPREQGGAFYMGSVLYTGNPDIKPESSRTWDIGVDVNYRSLDIYATYFNSNYKDRISNITIAPNERLYINLNKAYIRGVEAGASFNAGQRFNWGFDFTPYVALTRMTKYEDHTGAKINDIAKTSASFGARFRHPAWKLSTNLDFVYYGQRAEYEKDAGGNTIANLQILKNLADFGGAAGGDLKLKVAVNNLFDKYYRLSPNTGYLYLPGRSFYVGLVYDMK
ncbi:MAG: TonB-dependent receptor [Candidatus Accumulibacter sp.]|jgi:vitamin B12 transporter|nr:TonB-dependent receptor [Accumulibacter sp.]